jgi:hypothetical protein
VGIVFIKRKLIEPLQIILRILRNGINADSSFMPSVLRDNNSIEKKGNKIPERWKPNL